MITVLLFAGLQEKAGTDKISMEAIPATIHDLKERLADSYGLTNLDTVMTAVNEEYADDATTLKSGDTVAFIPPVSGG